MAYIPVLLTSNLSLLCHTVQWADVLQGAAHTNCSQSTVAHERITIKAYVNRSKLSYFCATGWPMGWLQSIKKLPSMKSYVIIMLAVLVLSAGILRAQDQAAAASKYSKAVFGIKGGLNLSILSASINRESKFKAGPSFGIYVKKQIGKLLYFRPELYYSNQGEKDSFIDFSNHQSLGATTTSLHYLNVPVLFETGGKFSCQFGGQLGFLLGGTEKGTIDNVKVDEKIKNVFNTVDFSLVLGMGYSFNSHLNAGARLNYGISNIYKLGEDPGSPVDLPSIQNRVFHFYLGYSF
jgi:hypothetical protein